MYVFQGWNKKETGGVGLAMNGLQESADSPPAPAVPKVGDLGWTMVERHGKLMVKLVKFTTFWWYIGDIATPSLT